MIIVTGGAGFIGSALIWRLNQLGVEDIIVVDEFGENDKWKNLVQLNFAEVFDKEDFGHMISTNFFTDFKIDTIFHLGACSSTTEKNFDYLLRNNYEYSKYICEKAIGNNVRFIYASSAATYGDGTNGYEDDESKLHTLKPLNGYGYSKHLFDLWARKSKVLDKIAGLKYFNVYGPNEYHKGEMRSVVNKCFEQIKNTGKARLFKSANTQYKDGEQRRDFLYIKEALDMTLFFWKNKIVNGIYNIGSGQSNSFNDLIKPVFKALEIDENIEYFEMPEILKEKYQYYTKANISKLENAGYSKVNNSIEDSVIDYVKCYLDTDNPYLQCGNSDFLSLH